MTILNGEKPSLDESLTHYGVKGMKWGVTKKPSRTEIVRARRNIRNQQEKLSDQRAKVRSASTKEKKVAEKAKYGEMKTAFLNNPDRVTSMRLSKGEAVAVAMFVSPAALGAIAVSRRTIAKKQARGAYDKK